MARRKGCLIGCGVALVIGIAGAVALAFGLTKVVDAANKTMIDPSVYAAVQVGDAEDAVRAKLPSGDSFIKDALKTGGPAEPAGSTCSWFVNGEGESAGETVYRLCFKDGKLAEKVQYPLQ
ncbi:hypothetical protein C0216_11640 [Streptomyces globosus]|uniref:Uncharacterized protein n=1 Tax=Streptomyces globosus TaxID=68209 RepID=A0A344TZF2_9ACTN|nr:MULTISPECIES: hypothetical protein [Streptomyces]AXE24023.1 hypothetical protein C0216_11640 [Streptomyces globosus]